jgi:hypothetical protein
MATDASEHMLTGWAWRCQRRHAICTVTALAACWNQLFSCTVTIAIKCSELTPHKSPTPITLHDHVAAVCVGEVGGVAISIFDSTGQQDHNHNI